MVYADVFRARQLDKLCACHLGYEQSGSALSTVGVLVLLSTDALCVWCVGAVLGWLPIPLMNANLDVLFRTYIPVKMQGRVYAARNSLPF